MFPQVKPAPDNSGKVQNANQRQYVAAKPIPFFRRANQFSANNTTPIPYIFWEALISDQKDSLLAAIE